MKVCLLQHSKDSPPGYLTSIFPEGKITRLDLGAKLPALDSFDFLISVGGSMHVSDKRRYPFLKDEARFIEKVLKEEKIFLGICLGAEILAEVLGAKVHRGGSHERGWQKIKLWEKEQMMFSNHHDRFDLPAGASRFATGEHCANQGFTYNEVVAALQFHPNSEASTIRKISEDARKKHAPAVQTTEEILEGLKHLDDQHVWLKDFCLNTLPAARLHTQS